MIPLEPGLELVDTRTGLASADYSMVVADPAIGDDAGSLDEALVSRNGLWSLGWPSLPPEPLPDEEPPRANDHDDHQQRPKTSIR